MNHSGETYRLVPLPGGGAGVFSSIHQEVFHPAVGAEAEAEVLYVRQLRLRERFGSVRRPFVIWDVGLGAAGNAVTAIRALGEIGGALVIESFDCTAGALIFALENLEALPALKPLADVLGTLASAREVRFRTGALDVEWNLRLGDAPKWLASPAARTLPKPDAILWDPHSPARNPEMWTLPLFRDVHRLLDADRACLLATYSRSTLVRTALLLAGFFVGAGQGVGSKEETTLAANVPGALEVPLGPAWLDRARRSGSAEPLHDATYRQQPLILTSFEQLRAHPQFGVA